MDLDGAVAVITGREERAEMRPVERDLDRDAEASTRKAGFLELGPIIVMGRLRIGMVVVIVVFVFVFVSVVLYKP
jgi:hypothetical protein|uniref:Uncharacterized protein n=1 Tax=Fagus sylvatica TaxID=28930 RepID=A0A2N9IV00_FAGSY